jgi:protein tyrosine/serine phosphatase
MKKRFLKSSATAVMFALLLTSALAQNGAKQGEVRNFHKVHDFLYRGGQPKKGEMSKLASMGIKTIINLRGEGDLAREEQKEAEATGLRYFSFPLSRMGRPSDETIMRIISIIDSSENQPVFIHCKLGSDRTGLVVAMHRLLHDGWTDKQAITEAKSLGMNWTSFALKDYVSDYYRDKIKASVESSTK